MSKHLRHSFYKSALAAFAIQVLVVLPYLFLLDSGGYFSQAVFYFYYPVFLVLTPLIQSVIGISEGGWRLIATVSPPVGAVVYSLLYGISGKFLKSKEKEGPKR
jgi:hypothetical protein